MKARPILMHGRSVRNLLAGRKTHTRRIAKLNAAGRVERGGRQWHIDDPDAIKASPKGQPGDLLYVRESWQVVDVCWDGWHGAYEAGYPLREIPKEQPAMACVSYAADGTDDGPWRPSIHMPRWASRITLRLTDVRVERVQEISLGDIAREGIEDWTPEEAEHATESGARALRGQWQILWDTTNGPGAWDRNDWVWALTFDVIHAKVDDVLADPARYGITEAA